MVTETALLRWIVALPALGVLFHAFLGRRLPTAVRVVGPGLVLGAFALALHVARTLWGLGPEAALRDDVYTWIAAGGFVADVAFRPTVHTRRKRPRRNAASPTRFTRNAFFPATAFSTLSYQKLMRR